MRKDHVQPGAPAPCASQGKTRFIPPPPDPQLTKIAGWCFVLIAITLGIFTFTRSFDKLRSESWPSAQAEVVTSDMYRRSGRGGSDWCVRLRYRYIIDHREFSSSRMSASRIGDAGCDRQKMVIDARLARMQPGARIKIRYDPADPGRAIVHSGAFDALDYLFPVIAVLLFAGGIKAVREARAMRRP